MSSLLYCSSLPYFSIIRFQNSMTSSLLDSSMPVSPSRMSGPEIKTSETANPNSSRNRLYISAVALSGATNWALNPVSFQ